MLTTTDSSRNQLLLCGFQQKIDGFLKHSVQAIKTSFNAMFEFITIMKPGKIIGKSLSGWQINISGEVQFHYKHSKFTSRLTIEYTSPLELFCIFPIVIIHCNFWDIFNFINEILDYALIHNNTLQLYRVIKYMLWSTP